VVQANQSFTFICDRLKRGFRRHTPPKNPFEAKSVLDLFLEIGRLHFPVFQQWVLSLLTIRVAQACLTR
jgi:hypothetical protein